MLLGNEVLYFISWNSSLIFEKLYVYYSKVVNRIMIEKIYLSKEYSSFKNSTTSTFLWSHQYSTVNIVPLICAPSKLHTWHSFMKWKIYPKSMRKPGTLTYLTLPLPLSPQGFYFPWFLLLFQNNYNLMFVLPDLLWGFNFTVLCNKFYWCMCIIIGNLSLHQFQNILFHFNMYVL